MHWSSECYTRTLRPSLAKLVNFNVTHSDGRLGLTQNSSPPVGALLAQVTTDSAGIAQAWWTMGNDACSGNNRVEATRRAARLTRERWA